jgi:hypothetical protein
VRENNNTGSCYGEQVAVYFPPPYTCATPHKKQTVCTGRLLTDKSCQINKIVKKKTPLVREENASERQREREKGKKSMVAPSYIPETRIELLMIVLTW